MTKKAL